MVLSKRERLILILAGIAVGILILNFAVVEPLLSRRRQLASDLDRQKQKLTEARQVIENSRKVGPRWHEMASVNMKSNDAAAASQVLRTLNDSANDAGLVLSSEKRERTEQEKYFQQIGFRAAGTGSMPGICRFLMRLQASKIPLRVTDLQINSRKDGVDDLQFQVGISTLCNIPQPQQPAKQAPAAAKDQEL